MEILVAAGVLTAMSKAIKTETKIEERNREVRMIVKAINRRNNEYPQGSFVSSRYQFFNEYSQNIETDCSMDDQYVCNCSKGSRVKVYSKPSRKINGSPWPVIHRDNKRYFFNNSHMLFFKNNVLKGRGLPLKLL
jgi:hypothetical protein